jgi:hypothetical protein
VTGQEDLLEKGFELAYFILPDRAQAVRIVTGAMNKLKAQSGRESRRAYWRDKHLKRGITRITRKEQDALQWLIFYETDLYEQEQEKSGSATIRDLVVRYIKKLVRVTTAMSSFHVNVGLHRLMHNYSTAETQRVYEAITERYLGADEYRRAKSVLMARLEKRFGDLLRTVRTQHGELRFEVQQDQGRWAALVDTCLKMFTPWSTNRACPVPNDYDASSEKLPARLSGKGPDKVDPNEIEINRCHAFIDPVCYGRLMQALTFDAPGQRLALPKFFMDTNMKDSSDHPPQPPALTPDERKQITDELSAQETRRKNANPQSVSVVVDGTERARLDLRQRGECAFEIQEGAELIELRTRSEGEDLLLAVHPLTYNQWHGLAPWRGAMFRRGLRRFDLAIVPGPETAEGPRHAAVQLSYTANPLSRLLSASSEDFWFAGLKYAAGGLCLVALGWILGTAYNARFAAPQQISSVPAPAKPVEQAVVQQPPKYLPEATARYSYDLVPDEMIVRSAGSPGFPTVTVPPHAVVVTLGLPVAGVHAKQSFRASLKDFAGRQEILSENLLTANKTSGGHAVAFSLPSVLLEDQHDYTVDLRSRSAGGGYEDAGSYTFRAVRTRGGQN